MPWHSIVLLGLLLWLAASFLIAVLVGKCMALGSRADQPWAGEETGSGSADRGTETPRDAPRL
jgi:hypothetical protein